MTWSTLEKEYEGFPLLLRRPDHADIWQFKKQFSQLVSIYHLLDKVTANGLPEKKYNKTLADFDHSMCSLFEKNKQGIIFLTETFGGKRAYYYYTSQDYDIAPLLKKIKRQYKVSIEVYCNVDKRWGFLKKYPVEIFPK